MDRMSVPLYGGSVYTKCYLYPIIIWICGLSSLLDGSFLIGIVLLENKIGFFSILSAHNTINCVHLR